MINRNKTDSSNNKTKILSTFFILKRNIEADYLILNTRKTLNFLQNIFIELQVFLFLI